MPLNNYPDIYHGRKSQIVSKEKGRKHTGLNPKGCCVTHYRVDGVILQNQTACDYILINETDGIAFLIELKGCRVDKAAAQLQATEEALREYLKEYKLQFRIVTSTTPSRKSRTTGVKTSYPKIIDVWKSKGQFKMQTNEIEEDISKI